MDIDEPPVKRGRGRPPGSLNQPKPPKWTPEEAAALRQHLANAYAEAIIFQAVAVDRQRRCRSSIREAFGRDALLEIENDIKAAEDKLLIGSSWRSNAEQQSEAA